MCGICGQFNVDGRPADLGVVRRMRAALVHRGPDDEGEFSGGPAALGFRRLSILDLEGGHQPMSTEDGRFTIVFNGEIYNHQELRRGLEASGARFATRSDTETILRLYARDGRRSFPRLNGMFAFAVWDARKKELVLARDPIGVKPLYYSFDGRSLSFSSEVRSLLAGGVGDELDPAGLLDYLAYGKVHAPRTIFQKILKLPPAHGLILNEEGLRLERYWNWPSTAAPRLGVHEATEELDRLLKQAVRGNMLADVPVGAFLSGGVDSSLVAALMARESKTKIKTFSVGFSGAERGVDESAHARAVASALGTEHHELMLPADVLSRLEDSIDLLDEPIADSAILPTFLLSRFARESVKVVLTGEGADELFAGYNRHKAAWLSERLKRLPGWSQKLLVPVARKLGKGEVFSAVPFEDARAWAAATASASFDAARGVLHPRLIEASRHGDPLEWLKDFAEMDRLNDALAFDLRTVLCDSLLMKVDKSTMRAGLEARVPFLDKPVVEFAAALPAGLKIRRFKGKYLLRRLAQRYLPKGVVWRRKHGFIVPWEAWVRSGSSSIENLLSSRAFAEREIFDMDHLRLFHDELRRGSRAVEAGLFFRIMVFGLWLESATRRKVAA